MSRHVLLEAVSRGGFSRVSTHALPLRIGRDATNGCAVPDFLDVSSEHASVDYDADADAFTLRDLGSRNGTYHVIAGELSRLEESCAVQLPKTGATFQLGNTLTFTVSLIDGPVKTIPLVRRRPPPPPSRTVPYAARSTKEIDSVLEGVVVADMDSAVDAYKNAVAAIRTVCSPDGALCSLVALNRRESLVQSLAARHPDVLSAEHIRAMMATPLSFAAPADSRCVEEQRTAPGAPADQTPSDDSFTTSLPKIAVRAARVVDLLLESARRTAHALSGSSAEATTERDVAVLRERLFETSTDDRIVADTVQSVFGAIEASYRRDVARASTATRLLAVRLAPRALERRAGWRRYFDLFGLVRDLHQAVYTEVVSHPLVAHVLVASHVRAKTRRSETVAEQRADSDAASTNLLGAAIAQRSGTWAGRLEATSEAR